MLSKYYVDGNGNILNMNTNKMLKPQKCRAGYLRVNLVRDDGKRKAFSIHRLVAIRYVVGRTKLHNEVNHIDGDKSNNYYKNLEWVTRKENMAHARETLKRKMGNIEQTKKNEMVEFLLTKFSNKDIAELLNTTSENITRIKNKSTKK